MKRTKKYFSNTIIFILLIILTFKLVFKDQSISEILQVVKSVKKPFILVAIFSMCVYVCCEALNITRILKNLHEKSSFLSNVKYAMIGFFFSGITPAASGGQPMQIYYMHKEKISVANSTLTLLINLFSMQIVTISLALIGVIFNHKLLTKPLIGFFILGIALNMSALLLLIIAIFSKNSLDKLIKLIIKIIRKLKIKSADKIEKKIDEEIEKYKFGSDYIKEHKKMIFKTLLITYVEFLALYSVTYWVYRSFGFNEYSMAHIIGIQSVLYGTVSGIPSPGAVGVTEGGFIEIFKTIFPEHLLRSAMILNRGINFYLLMVICGIVTIINATKLRKEKTDNLEYAVEGNAELNKKDIENNEEITNPNLESNINNKYINEIEKEVNEEIENLEEKNETINILLCGNEKVFDGALTELISITNKTKHNINCYIFTMNLTRIKPEYKAINDKQIEFLNKVVKSKNADNKVTKIDVTDIYEKEFGHSKNENAYCTPYTLLRLFADLVPNMPDKILYLDIDMMANDDIAKLYNTDITNYEYAAVKEKYGSKIISPDYINAGMLLMNMKEIKRTKLLEKARKLIKKKKLIFADQSAIYYSTTKKLILPRKFNEQSKFDRKDTVICHFCKRLIFNPYPHTENYKQWQIEEVHNVLKCYTFDKDLEEYVKLKNNYKENKLQKQN